MLPEHIWSKIAPKAADELRQQAARSSAPGPSRRSAADEQQLRPSSWRPTRTTGAGVRRSTRSSSQTYENADNMVNDLIAGGLEAACEPPRGAVRAAAEHVPSITAIAYETKGFDELGFNCYTGKTSLGNPVLKDWKFRQALNYAVDHQAIVDRAYLGHRHPGDDDHPVGLLLQGARLALGAARRPEVHLRPREGQGGARRGRLHRHERRRHPRLQGQADRPAPLGAQQQSQTSQRGGRFITGWFQSDRPEDQVRRSWTTAP